MQKCLKNRQKKRLFINILLDMAFRPTNAPTPGRNCSVGCLTLKP